MSCSRLEGTARLLTEHLPGMSAPHRMEDGWELGLSPPTHCVLQQSGDYKCRFALCSALIPTLLFFPGCSRPYGVPAFLTGKEDVAAAGAGLGVMEGSRGPKSG